MAKAEDALEWMRERLGIGEDPAGSNHNSITDFWGLGNVAWCAETVSLALNVAWGDQEKWQVPGVKADYLLGTAYVPNLRRHFIDAGLYDQTPRVGDVVIFTWGPGEPIGDHTGMVEQVVGDGTVVTLEGNHNDDLVRMRRSMAVIDGFGHPPYAPVPAPTPKPTPPASTKETMPMNFTYVAKKEDFVYLGTEGFCGRLPFGDTLDGLKKSKQLADLGQQSDQFHAGVKALADQLKFLGDRA